jgi:hypothetical protein
MHSVLLALQASHGTPADSVLHWMDAWGQLAEPRRAFAGSLKEGALTLLFRCLQAKQAVVTFRLEANLGLGLGALADDWVLSVLGSVGF